MIFAGSGGMDPSMIEWTLLVMDSFIRRQRQSIHFGDLEILIDFRAQVEWVRIVVQIRVTTQTEIEPTLQSIDQMSSSARSSLSITNRRFESPHHSP